MKRICLIDYDMSVLGGVEQVTAALSSALADRYEVHLLSICSKGEPAYSLDPRVRYAVLQSEAGRLRSMVVRTRKLLRAYFRENRIDVALLQGTYPGLLAAFTRPGSKTKLIFCDHGALMNQWHEKKVVLMRRIASALCHRVVTLTEQSREAYCKKFLLPKKKVSSISNWIDLSLPRSQRYDEASKRIVSAGRFGREKGFDQLVKAFAPVAKKHPDWKLDIFGDGEMMPQIRQLVCELSLDNSVNLLGMRSDLAQRYGDYAMYVLPSYREGMPLVLLEAKANRLPIVSFDVQTGPGEIVRDGVDGLLVPPRDTEMLASAMCRLIEDGALRRKMSDASQTDLDRFSKETILVQWLRLIESL